MVALFDSLPAGVLSDAKRPLFVLLLGFIVTFAVARINTRVTRARGRSSFRIGSVVTPGGLHIHHSVFGVVGMIVAGILMFALQPGSPGLELLALGFGASAALTLDEFALILHLDDVYWTGEGRTSLDAVILGVTFITLLLTGLLPASINEFGDYVAVSRWAGFALILSGAAFVVVCYLKGKLFMGTVGIFVPPIAVIGGVRLARPGSPWAHYRYARRPGRLERARRRDDVFHRRWERRKHAVWDLIGGNPHLPHLPLSRHHDDDEPGSGLEPGAGSDTRRG